MTGGPVEMVDSVSLPVAEVVALPAASRARADSAWPPFDTGAVFQEIEYGDAVTSAPRFAPSSRNWTPATPTLSDADAETMTPAPETVAPPAGAVIDTVGDVRSLFTVTVTPADVAVLPAPSRATAV